MLSTITCSQKAKQAIYRPRRPEKTELFKIIKKNYRNWKAQTSKPVKGYVEKVFELLPPKELSVCASVCKAWQIMADQEKLWKNFITEKERLPDLTSK